MKFLALTLFFTYVTSLPYSIIEDEDGQEYHLVPLSRVRRQNQKTDFKLQSPGIATVSHTGTLLNNQNHRLDGTGYASKDFSKGGGIRPDAFGGNVDYTHKPTRIGLGLGADHVRQAGTDVKATAKWNFIQTKDAEFGVGGQYGRHFGHGGGRPDYGVFVGGKFRF